MRKNNLTSWTYTDSLECLLFFAQRMDELLFHHTTDTYRYSALSIRGLAAEYCAVYRDVNAGTLNKMNLNHIIDEFVSRLKDDDIAKDILTNEYVTWFIKNHGAWDIQNQYENLKYIGRKLSNRVYYSRLVNRLRELIIANNQKREINEKASVFVRELLDYGYNENYIYNILHETFFYQPVSSIESFDDFLNKFDFSEKKYDVYIGYSDDLSSLFPLFKKLVVADLKISMLDSKSVPTGIRTRRQKTILRFEKIESYDMYTAFEIANAISSCVVNAYSFFRHEPNAVHTYGQVVDESGNIVTIQPKKLLKHRVAILSREDSTKNAESLIKVLFTNYENLSDFMKVTRTHNSAIYSENTSESLLSLWSILESIVEEDRINDKLKSESNNVEKERSKIGNVISYTLPYLKSTYIQKLVQTCMLDIMRWDAGFFEAHIAKNGFGNSNLEHTFAFLAFQSTKSAREELYSKTEAFPLLRYRVYTLSDQLHNSKGIKAVLKNHVQRINWHLHRIYRARNYIVHDATENEQMNQELLINLHSYVDTLFLKAIELIDSSPYNDSIHDALIGHKLSVQIMDEILENKDNEDITAENALKFLYYDFEK